MLISKCHSNDNYGMFCARDIKASDTLDKLLWNWISSLDKGIIRMARTRCGFRRFANLSTDYDVGRIEGIAEKSLFFNCLVFGFISPSVFLCLTVLLIFQHVIYGDINRYKKRYIFVIGKVWLSWKLNIIFDRFTVRKTMRSTVSSRYLKVVGTIFYKYKLPEVQINLHFG